MVNRDLWFGAMSGYIGLVAGIFLVSAISPRGHFPVTEDVEHDYVVPSKLDIKVGDLRNDGAKQTMVVYDGK